MSGRNALGARLPPAATGGPPRLLPDGSESRHHGGSFGAYMALKEAKLQEQFLAQAAGEQRTQLFAGVRIHVDGFTQPSHLELKQLMALHGGEFHNYYHRGRVTHIICCNLPDAKVKQIQRERDPTPIVRPEWVVDSIKAGRLLPTQDYALLQLRDAPGQRKLKAFAQVQAAALPASALYGEQAGALGEAAAAAAAAAGEAEPGTFAQPPADPMQQDETAMAAGAAQDLPGLPSFSSPALQQPEQQRPQEQGPPLQLPQPLQDSATAAGGLGAASAAASGSLGSNPPLGLRSPAARSPSSGAAAGSDGRRSPGGYSESQLRQAQQLASRMRAECDMLKGPPKSTKDDPHFAVNFWKASRLHFIGTWRARIEALMASSAGSEGPSPEPHVPGRPRTVIHLDMDCFFASVTEAAHPEFKGMPLAVCHSASAKGTGEVSTSNYEARRYGVKSGMFMGQAKELCPHLVVVPFLFEQYQTVSEKVYRILLSHTACVQPLSCDEAYLDVTGLGDPEELAAAIRAEIEQETGCTASAGIGPSPLLARIATDQAKPNGQLLVSQQQARQYLQSQPVDVLPGVGGKIGQQLGEKGVKTVADLLARSREWVQAELGPKAGAQLYDYAQGKDERPVEPPKARKSVGAEVNWGVRFKGLEDAYHLLDDIAAEVEERLVAAGLRGSKVTLKLKRRKPGAPEPLKFMGHGICDNLSRSAKLGRFTASAADIAEECRKLLRALQVPFADIRGMGIQVTGLDNEGATRPGPAQQAGQLQHMFKKQQERQQQEQAQQRQQSAEAEAGEAEWQGAAAHVPSQQQQQQQQQPSGAGQRSPTPQQAKQPSLEELLGRQAAAAAGAGPSDAAASVQERQLLVQQYQGATLSQMDADVLAALPWSVQKELIERLPRGRQQQQQQQPQPQQLEPPAAAQQQLAQQLEGAASVTAAHAAAEPQQQRQQKRLWEPGEGESSDEEAGWEPDSQPEAAAAVAALPAPPERTPQQAGSAASGSAAGGGGCGRPGTPIEALPALSQIDPSVLDVLPIQMRWELERAYGIHRPRQRPSHAAPHGRGRGAPAAGGLPRHVSKRQRIDSFVANPPPFGVSASGRAVAARQQQLEQQLLSLSQVDPAVLAELPPEVQQEVVQQLQQGAGGTSPRRPGKAPQPRSRLGLQRDEAQAWQRRWAEEQQQRDAEQAAAIADDPLLSQASQEQPVWQLQGEEAAEEDGSGAALPPAVQRFAELVAEGSPVPCLASALAECLQQLDAAAAGAASPQAVPGDSPGSAAASPPASSPESSSGGSAAGGSGGMEVELPPTQPVVLEGQEAQGEARAAAEALARSGSERPSRDGKTADAAAAAVSPCSLQPARQALQALGRSLQLAAGSLLLARDLEQLRLLLLAVQRLGRLHPWFAAAAGDEAVEAAQQRVAAQYGWRLRLRSLLEAAPAAEGGGA